MKKYFKNLIMIGSACCLILTGCDLFKSEEEKGQEATVTLDASNKTTVASGDTLSITGTLTGTDKIKTVIQVFKGTDEIPLNDDVVLKIYTKAAVNDVKEADLDLKLVPSVSIDKPACAGDYKLVVKSGVPVGEGVEGPDSVIHEFSITGIDCDQADVETDTVTMGAQNATPGSAIDLDLFEVYTRSAAATNSDKIDLYFGALSSGTKLFSPLEAAKYATLDPHSSQKNWATANDTKFYLLDLTVAKFNNIISQHQIDALWDDSEDMEGSYEFNDEDIFIIETDEGKLALLQVVSSDKLGTSQTIVVKSYK